jgi:Peptidase A4 family
MKRLRRLFALLAMLWLALIWTGTVSASASAPGRGSSSDLALTAVRRQALSLKAAAGPARDRERDTGNASAQFTSRNWDGYITYVSSEGTDFNVVKATWIQPSVQCEQPDAWTVFWVGLDGWWNNTVEQGGSSAQCVRGVPHYTTWWEMYPTNAIQTVFTIRPGDKITAIVTYKPASGVFVITVRDVTSGHSFTQNQHCASKLTCARSSADVIAEDVSHFGGSTFFPLADYKTMSFTGAAITDTTGHSGSFSDSAWLNAAVMESSGGTTYATVSALSSTGQRFSATWRHA